MKAFTKFFKLRTGKEWEERFDETPLPLKKDEDGNILSAHEGWYQYENQMGLLASFLRHGPGDTAGGREHGPDSLQANSTARHGGVSEQHNVNGDCKGSEHEQEFVHSGEEKEGRSECMSMEPDEWQQEGNMVGSKSMEDGTSMEAAILID